MPYRLLVLGEVIEVHMSGVLDGMGLFAPEDWELVRALKKVLYNFDDVEGVTFDPWKMAESLERMAARGIVMAGYAERPAWFGVSRQLEQMSEASNGSIRAFNSRELALNWLLRATPERRP